MNKKRIKQSCLSLLTISVLLLVSCDGLRKSRNMTIYEDINYSQEFSVKYFCSDSSVKLKKVVSDRNGNITILTGHGLMKPAGGSLLYPGTIVTDNLYRPVTDKNIRCITEYEDQFVYCDDKAVLSNAWAGKLYSPHSLPEACMVEGGSDNTFMISDRSTLQLLNYSGILWEGKSQDEIRDIVFDKQNNAFWILGKGSLSIYTPGDVSAQTVLTHQDLTCISLYRDKLIAGTSGGWFEMDT